MIAFSSLRPNFLYRALSRSLAALLMTGLLNACSPLQPLPVIGGKSAHGAWIELNDIHTLTLSPGVYLDLPDAPYRAKFADPNGTFFQASQNLKWRNQDGALSEKPGGLYVRYDKPGEATPWAFELLGAALIPYPHLPPLKVQYFSGE